jgi:hypothetical protein
MAYRLKLRDKNREYSVLMKKYQAEAEWFSIGIPMTGPDYLCPIDKTCLIPCPICAVKLSWGRNDPQNQVYRGGDRVSPGPVFPMFCPHCSGSFQVVVDNQVEIDGNAYLIVNFED